MRPTPRRPGLAAVEFAAIVPFLALLVIGIAEVARAIVVRQVLNDAVRKGCRTGTLPNRATADITTDVTNILSDNSISTSAATITVLVNGQNVDASTAVRGDQVSVQVSIPFSQVSWGIARYLGSSATVQSTLVMQRQG
jgi:Flp pilus assembly protein TadG